MVAALLFPFLIAPIGLGDPAPSLTRSKKASRNLECTYLTAEEASLQRPGLVQPSKPRGDYIDRQIVLCTERLLRPGVRATRDEAILEDLNGRTSEIARSATAEHPELAERTWLVETHFPNPQVATKISFATKNALMDRSVAVSDRTPTLAFGDVDVLSRMPPSEAYPAACERYAANETLAEGDVLLAIVLRDLRETMLHAGICVDGAWTWLR